MFEIVGVLDIPLALDDVTIKRTFNHSAIVLIDVDLNADVHERNLVESNEFGFYMNVEYEKLSFLQRIMSDNGQFF